MRDITEIEADISTWEQARRAVAAGQTYSIQNRSLTKADLPDINAQLASFYRERRGYLGQSTTAIGTWS